jgi:hypothetical protein
MSAAEKVNVGTRQMVIENPKLFVRTSGTVVPVNSDTDRNPIRFESVTSVAVVAVAAAGGLAFVSVLTSAAGVSGGEPPAPVSCQLM